jgi:glucan 1,3-beta-glucosidase
MIGVNLGGWLVLEPWLTPSLFKGSDAPDEFTYCTRMNSGGLRRLRKHYREFITEADFAWLSEQGVEAVRLPVGYWLFGDVAPFQATFPYVDKTLQWAEKYGLKVLIDLHGAPGSQNGEMHSGQQGNTLWAETANIEHTLHVLARIGSQYGQHPALLGIEYLNEPSPSIKRRVLEQFYKDAHDLLRPLCGDDAWLVFGDAFRPRRWYRRLKTVDYPQQLVDYHHYQLFSRLDKYLPVSVQLWRAKHSLKRKVGRMAKHHPLIVGEWSNALRSEKIKKYDASNRLLTTRRYCHAQLQMFEPAAAWFYWTYKTESPNAWNFRHCVEQGILRLK